MRYDTPVYFQRIQAGDYDPNTGNYGEDTIEEVKRYADVTDTGADTLRIVYGEIRQDSRVIRLQRPYKEPFNQIRVGDKVYTADYCRELRSKQTFIVSEVQ